MHGIAMAVRRKVFRIEEMQAAPARASAAEAAPLGEAASADARELTALRSLIERRSEAAPQTSRQAARSRWPAAAGLRQLGPAPAQGRTDIIHRAITRTKEEIAALHVSGLTLRESGRAARELECAPAARARDPADPGGGGGYRRGANTLRGRDQARAVSAARQDIRDQVIRIFEACNFQDLAGQRIAKVLTTLKIPSTTASARMMDIWGGIDAFKDYTAAAIAARGPGAGAAQRPQARGETGHASQEDIDALFSTSE